MAFRLTRKMALTVIVLIWAGAALVMLPNAIFHTYIPSPYLSTSLKQLYVCYQEWPSEEQVSDKINLKY